MEIDLELHGARAATFHSQVCIVGAGIAGLTLAHRLNQQGIAVALLEAGSHTLDWDSPGSLPQAQLSGSPHLGTTEGRFRVFGGSSLRWGGQLLPLPGADEAPPAQTSSGGAGQDKPSQETVADDAAGTDSWPIPAAALAPYYREAERLLGVDDLPYEASSFFERARITPPAIIGELAELTATFSKWTPFSRRNLASSIGATLLKSPNLNVYLHAQVTELLLAASRTHLAAVLVRTASGSMFRFEAEEFIVAAGTVETSRLLLASRSVAPGGVGNAHDQVGRNFHDHLTVPAASLTGAARDRLLREAGFWVVPQQRGTTMHSAKVAASEKLRQRHGLNSVLAHVTIEEPEGSGLATLRALLLAAQQGSLRSGLAAHGARIPGAALEATRALWSARLHQRRYVSARAAVTLRLNAAQDVPSRSRITLSDRSDPVGVPQPDVNWCITAHEIATLRNFASYLRASFESLALDGFGWRPELFSADAALPSIEDARHAMGGACMGVDPRTSVVSPDLNVHGIANLSIAGAGTFPTGSAHLPTLPMMALALRLADRIARGLRK